MNISLYSNVGLSVKEYPLANELFHHFLWEEGKPLSDDVIQQLSEQISASKAFQEKSLPIIKLTETRLPQVLSLWKATCIMQ